MQRMVKPNPIHGGPDWVRATFWPHFVTYSTSFYYDLVQYCCTTFLGGAIPRYLVHSLKIPVVTGTTPTTSHEPGKPHHSPTPTIRDLISPSRMTASKPTALGWRCFGSPRTVFTFLDFRTPTHRKREDLFFQKSVPLTIYPRKQVKTEIGSNALGSLIHEKETWLSGTKSPSRPQEIHGPFVAQSQMVPDLKAAVQERWTVTNRPAEDEEGTYGHSAPGDSCISSRAAETPNGLCDLTDPCLILSIDSCTAAGPGRPPTVELSEIRKVTEPGPRQEPEASVILVVDHKASVPTGEWTAPRTGISMLDMGPRPG